MKVSLPGVRRTTVRSLGLSALYCLVALSAQDASAATITVNSNSGGTGGPDCTLRDAITAANSDAATGGCAAGDAGADIIELPAAATITLTAVDNATQGANGLPVVTSEITINGNGATIERQAGLACDLDGTTEAGEFRIVFVNLGGNLTLNDLTLRNGCADASSLGFESFGGGALLWSDASLALNGVTVTDNASSWVGGGIADVGGVLTISQSAILNNQSDMGGGLRSAGTLSISDSTINMNQATQSNGGGLLVDGGTASLLNSTVDGNSASGNGGGIFNFGLLTITQSTISNNSSSGSGGGILNTNIATGLVMLNSTLSGNGTVVAGGGLFNGGPMQIGSSTLTDNTAQEGGGLYIDINADGYLVQIMNSIVADNPAGSDCDGSLNLLVAMEENLDSDGSCPNFSFPNRNPMLGPLQDNGGATLTHALAHGSPAIDAILIGACVDFSSTDLTLDQRGVARPYDGDANGQAMCDIGAFEQASPPPPRPSVPIPVLPGWLIPLLGLAMAGGVRRRLCGRS